MYDPQKGEKVSPVATDKTTKARQWMRTSAQEELVEKHLELVREQYAKADPKLRKMLLDETIWGTPELVARFALGRGSNRTYQWSSAREELAAANQLPHPAGAPVPDATAGYRGEHEITGSIAGRWLLWAIQSGKWHWDSVSRDLVRQTYINHGGAPPRARNS